MTWNKRGKPGKILLLRADKYALPMDEETGLDFASEIVGRSHVEYSELWRFSAAAMCIATHADQMQKALI